MEVKELLLQAEIVEESIEVSKRGKSRKKLIKTQLKISGGYAQRLAQFEAIKKETDASNPEYLVEAMEFIKSHCPKVKEPIVVDPGEEADKHECYIQ